MANIPDADIVWNSADTISGIYNGLSILSSVTEIKTVNYVNIHRNAIKDTLVSSNNPFLNKAMASACKQSVSLKFILVFLSYMYAWSNRQRKYKSTSQN